MKNDSDIPESLGRSGGLLAVDLDGTLINSDMLVETFWDALGKDYLIPFKVLTSIPKGIASFKRSLSMSSSVDVSKLPYNSEVVDYINTWKQGGGKVALVTATDELLANQIAQHLGIFDEVHGSDGKTNLKGAEKRQRLIDLYGARGFSYMGDSQADLTVWEASEKAITVNASPSLKRDAESLGVEFVHINSTPQEKYSQYARAMRPHQWLKNILIFVPMLAAHNLEMETLLLSTIAFVAFCAIASGVYLLNDLLDLSSDRAHPRKCTRPFAAGAIPIAVGSVLAVVLILFGLFFSVIVGTKFLLLILAYLVVTTSYSLRLKQIVIVDIITLATLYSLRIVAGGAATGTEISPWLIAFSVFFFLSLASVKRQAELIDNINSGKLVSIGRGYRTDDLPVVSQIVVCSGYVAVLVLVLYTQSPAVTELYHFPQALLGICFVLLYWITRIAMLTHRGGMHDDPIIFAAKDKNSFICALLVLGFILLGVSPL